MGVARCVFEDVSEAMSGSKEKSDEGESRGEDRGSQAFAMPHENGNRSYGIYLQNGEQGEQKSLQEGPQILSLTIDQGETEDQQEKYYLVDVPSLDGEQDSWRNYCEEDKGGADPCSCIKEEQ